MDVRDRQVRFEYCISLIFLTVRRESEIVTLKPGQYAVLAGLPYSLITLLLGWWGIPWGVFLTPIIVWRNLVGGQAVSSNENPSSRPEMLPS